MRRMVCAGLVLLVCGCPADTPPAPAPDPRPALGPEKGSETPPEPEPSPACLVELAEVHLRHGGPERALKLLGQAAARSTDPSEQSAAYRRLAEVLQVLGRKEDAITNLRTAAQLAPEPGPRRRIYEDLARALAGLGRPAEEAEAWWAAALAAGPDDDVSHILRSRSEALRQAGRVEAERERLRVELEGLEPGPRAREAYLALLPPRDPERLRLLEEDAAARPADPLVLAQLVGELDDAEHRTRKAELYRMLAGLLPPQRGRYLERLARLEMGVGNRESAREIAREMAGPGADDDSIVRGARLLVELERAPEAEPLLRPLIERAADPPRRQALELELASALASAGALAEARAIRERIARDGADESLRRRATAELAGMR